MACRERNKNGPELKVRSGITEGKYCSFPHISDHIKGLLNNYAINKGLISARRLTG